MEFVLFLEKILSNLWLTIPMYIVFLLVYLFIFRKRIWSIVDPLFIQVIGMASAAYCVFILTFFNLIKVEYSTIFTLTELAFLFGFFIVRNSQKTFNNISQKINFNLVELKYFLITAGSIYFISQIIAFKIIGFVLFKSDTNHLFAYQEHSTLRVFLTYSRDIFLITLFYKKHLFGRLSIIEKLMIAFTIISTLLGGSKSALLTFFALYLIVDYIYNRRHNLPVFKIKKVFVIGLILSSLLIITIQSNRPMIDSLGMLFYRFIGSGDIFVLGYNENAIAAIHEKSGFKYIFYPGLGTLLKSIFNFDAPHIVGVDITEYYTGKTDSGPNARHNFIGMIFWGYGGIIFSFICGFLISWVRNNLIFFDKKNTQFLYFILMSILTYSITDLITDANLFMNNLVWSLFMLVIIYFVASFVTVLLHISAGKIGKVGGSTC